MVASGSIRTAVDARLIELIAGLDGFSAAPTVGAFHVTGPLNSAPRNRRWCVIGLANGTIEPDAIGAGHGPSVDSWGSACSLGLTDIADATAAKQACEDALNKIADLFAADDTLGMPDGPRDVAVAGFTIETEMQTGKPRFTFARFDITAVADIWRNQ